MNQTIVRIIFQTLLTLTIFSVWAGFALLVINKLFFKDLPGYIIGRICIWELAVIILAGFLGQFLIRKWGNINLEMVGSKLMLTMNPKYGIFYAIYFLLAIIIGIWQFWMFSQQF